MNATARAQVVEYLARHVSPGIRRWNGQVPVDVDLPTMAREIGMPLHSVVEGLWHLQKQQVVTFRERKGAKNDSYISRIRLAEAYATSPVTATDVETKPEAIRRVMGEIIEEHEVADEIKAEAKDLFIERGTCKARKDAPEWCVNHDSIWMRGDATCAAEFERAFPKDETGANVAQYDNSAAAVSPEAAESNDLIAILVPPAIGAYPEVDRLIGRYKAGLATDRASEILAEAGMDDLALAVAEGAPTLSALDKEVIALARVLGWLDGE